MPFNKMTAEVENISKLSDTPNTGADALTAQQLKAEFDKGPARLKAFINSFLDVLGLETAASNIGATILTDEQRTTTTLQGAIDVLYEAIKSITVDTDSIEDGAVTTAKIGSGAVTAEKVAAGAVSTIYTANVGTVWSGNAAPYSQEISVSGLSENDRIVVDLAPDGTAEAIQAQTDAWSQVYRAVSTDGKLTLYVLEKPTTAFQIKILAVKK